MERKNINLNSGWYFALHPGLDADQNVRPEEEEYQPVTLPHDWAISRPFRRDMEQGAAQGFRDRYGVGWYKRNLEIAEKNLEKVYELNFDGIYEDSTIWMNGHEIGGRKYGYSSFKINATDYIEEGNNELLVRVNNTKTPVDRWYSGAGIYRKVTLTEVPVKHLEPEDFFVTMNFSDRVCKLEVHMDHPEHVQALLVKNSYTYEGKLKDEVIEIEVPDYIPWSAEQPELYELELKLMENGTVVDRITMKTGLREVVIDPNHGLFVNGKSVKLKGVCIHQDAGCLGNAVPPEIWKERLLKLKEFGCNAIRLAHHLYMPEMLEICDELGFYVYEESFDKWTGGLYGRYYETEWEKDLTCMVRRDRNHPCIVIWGVGNEVENQACTSMLSILKKFREKVLEYDTTRPISCAMNPHFKRERKIRLEEVKDIQQFVDEIDDSEIFDVDERIEQIKRIAEYVDILACNYQEQWYEKIHAAIPEKAILGTETYQYFRGLEDKFQNFSEDCPWLDVEKLDYCIGGMLWTGIDYLGESMEYPAKGWSGALFATDMECRPMAYQYKSYWSKEHFVHFAVMDYSIPDEGVKEHWDAPRYVSHWEFPQFRKTVIPFMIASNCDMVELYVNEKQFLQKRPSECPNRMITGFVPYLPGKVTVYGYKNGLKVCEHILKTPGIAVRLQFEEEEYKLPVVKEDETYTRMFKVRVYDAEGNAVFREARKVQFIVEGAAEILAVDNGDIKGEEPYQNDRIHLFRGRASVAVRFHGNAGVVKLSAYADGMFAGTALICTERG